MKRFIESLAYAMRGIWFGIVDQRNLKVQIAVSMLVIVAGIYFNVTPIEWCLLFLCIGLVISLELINSAIEGLVDLVTIERKMLAGKIKDIAAGAVLIASLVSIIIGVILFGKYLLG
ncbi:MAG: diacylglycerol kinase family protein [Cyclobacteriaceae bacterium]|nr:diacylglycerol kinase family protein [Cyclobacteriaceae bacterium]MDH5248692.1 diacylglycerol kinase family protein [Cyclobacteriaceae bacterium]